jgi:parallel beta-helix repeat protein
MAFGLVLLIGFLSAVDAARSPGVARAQGPTVRYVDGAAGTDGGNTCITSTTPCATVQHAVDVAAFGDEIRVAGGLYTGVQARAGVTQVVYISKTVTVRGGYTTTDWTTSEPIAYPTTLDAQRQGRVLFITGDVSATVEGLRITGGDASGLGGIPSGACGGGVYITGSAALTSAITTLSDDQIISNTAPFGGGLCVYARANVKLAGNMISSNNRDQWWTHAAGGYFRDSPGAKLITNTISSNGSDQAGSQLYGGILLITSHNATLIGNVVSRNLAPNGCGGLCFHSSDDVVLERNIVTGNHGGGGNGGGLWLYNSNVVLTNIVIADNRVGASSRGSGLYVADSSPRLLHTTVARNGGGDGSGIYVASISSGSRGVALTNTILISQTVGITVTAGNTATLDSVLWYSNTTNHGGSGLITVANEYTGDPAFAADGYHLTAISAAIDNGVDAGVDEDIEGDPRPQSDGYDLGADEFVCRIFLPLVLKASVT